MLGSQKWLFKFYVPKTIISYILQMIIYILAYIIYNKLKIAMEGTFEC